MASAHLIIRPAKVTDLPAADAMERANFTAHPISLRQLRYLQRNQKAIFLVATSGGVVVGDGIALLRRHHGKVLSGRVYSVVVDPAHRRQKIGEGLMSALLNGLTAHHARNVYLEVEHSNAGAIRLYERLGFKIVNSLRHYYGRGRHGVRMKMQLKRDA